MQNKKTLLQRLLFLYATFFIVIVVSIAHGILPGFLKGYSDGMELGDSIGRSWVEGKPRLIYLLNVPVHQKEGIALAGSSDEINISARASRMVLTVEQAAPNHSIMGLVFSSIGGRPWMYALVMLSPLCFVAIIVLMVLIIHSLRRSIREECSLERRNIWMLRAIGVLTILTELSSDFVHWQMARQAAGLIADKAPYAVDTGFHVSYITIIMGILILFAAEVFAIGQNLSEEQKFTI